MRAGVRVLLGMWSVMYVLACLLVQVILRDGRNLVGTLRSFDQFSNMVMQDTVERRTVNGACNRCWLVRCE